MTLTTKKLNHESLVRVVGKSLFDGAEEDIERLLKEKNNEAANRLLDETLERHINGISKAWSKWLESR